MKKINKVLTALVAAAVSAGATGSIAYAKNSGKNTEAPKKSVKASADSEAASRESNGESAYKDETVYVLCNSDSSVKNVVVSDWLKNSPALVNISDISAGRLTAAISTTRAIPTRSSPWTLPWSTSLTARKWLPRK